MIDMSDTIVPKSDQTNADDLLSGPRTITITKVARCAEAEQPIAVHFEGDAAKPYRPCKSMRRVMVTVWGPDAEAYKGRSMTLYRDPSVTWGGMEVGGIRISHMSHMDAPVVLALTATKKARKPYKVLPLILDQPRTTNPDDAARTTAAEMVAHVDAIDAPEALAQFNASESANSRRKRLAERYPELARDVESAVMAARDRVSVKTGPDTKGGE